MRLSPRCAANLVGKTKKPQEMVVSDVDYCSKTMLLSPVNNKILYFANILQIWSTADFDNCKTYWQWKE